MCKKTRLKTKDLAKYREDILKAQNNICPLCRTHIKPEEACLDHCHSTGHVRRVLHRACNSSEGRVMKWAYSSRSSDPFTFLLNLIEYHRHDFTDMPFHPNHLTPTEKEIKKLRKHQKKLKTQKARDRYQTRIDALIAMGERD